MSISVENLTFSYGNHKVLNGVSFQAGDGELISLLGANGAGKSTLFKCILGLLSGYTGKTVINGCDTAKITPKELSRLVAYIPQSHYPSFNYSILDMVLMGMTSQLGSFSSPKREHIEKAESALERLGILSLRDKGFTQVSGGERQLALIARAITQNAQILIMDEPASNLDYGNQIRLIREIRTLAAEGYTVIQSTHNPDQAFLSSGRILALKGGQIIADGSPKDVITKDFVKEVYGVDVEIMNADNGKARFCMPLGIL